MLNSNEYQATTLHDALENDTVKDILACMLQQTEEDRGTVQASAADALNFADDGMLIIISCCHCTSSVCKTFPFAC